MHISASGDKQHSFKAGHSTLHGRCFLYDKCHISRWKPAADMNINTGQLTKVLFMMTSSNGNIFHVTGSLWGEPPVTGQWRGTLMFPLSYAWTNGWANTRDAGDLRRHCAHHDVTVMFLNWILSFLIKCHYAYHLLVSEMFSLRIYHHNTKLRIWKK